MNTWLIDTMMSIRNVLRAISKSHEFTKSCKNTANNFFIAVRFDSILKRLLIGMYFLVPRLKFGMMLSLFNEEIRRNISSRNLRTTVKNFYICVNRASCSSMFFRKCQSWRWWFFFLNNLIAPGEIVSERKGYEYLRRFKSDIFIL